jgi:hypothetical protein
MLGFACLAMTDSARDGRWAAEVVRPAPAGNRTLAITLNTKEGKVTGLMLIQGAGESPIEWGIIKGDLITFKVQMPFNIRIAILVYLGKLVGPDCLGWPAAGVQPVGLQPARGFTTQTLPRAS